MFYKAFYLYRREAYNEAQKVLKDLLIKNPKNIPAFTVLSYCLLSQQDHSGALQLFDQLPEDVVIPDEKLGINCLANIISGDQESTKKLLKELELRTEQKTAFQAHSYLFLAYANLNRPDEAFHLLERSLANRSPIFLISYSDPLAHTLRNNARYSLFHQQIYPPTPVIDESLPKNPALLDEATAILFAEKLEAFMEQESPFLNPKLSLRSLAELIEIHPNQLSWILNTQLQKNFNEFVNLYRIAHFKTLVKDPSNKHISIVGLAFESGFNSKTVFNTFFQKGYRVDSKRVRKKSRLVPF